MVTAIERIEDKQALDAASLDDLRLDSKGLGEFDVAKVNPVNPQFNINQLNNEREPINNDANVNFFLPKDPDKRAKILEARQNIRIILNEMTKLEDFDPEDEMAKAQARADKSNYVDFYLKKNDLTRDEVAGKYPSPKSDMIVALSQGANKQLKGLLDQVIDLNYMVSPAGSIEKINQSVNPDIDFVPSSKKAQDKLYEVFEFLRFIDPSFTSDTFPERVAENMGAFIIDTIPLSGALTTVNAANKIVVKDPETLKGVFSKAKNNLSLMYNQIIDIYDQAKKTGNLGKVVADDILAVMGFSAGTDVSEKLSKEAFDPGLLGTPLSLATRTLGPFIGAGAFMGGKAYLYDAPIAMYGAAKNFIKNYRKFNKDEIDKFAKQKSDEYLIDNPEDIDGAARVYVQNIDDPEGQNIAANLVKFYRNRREQKKNAEISLNIKGQINKDEIANREKALELEDRINKVVVQTVEEGPDGNQIIVQRVKNLRDGEDPSLTFTLAQGTKGVPLLESQKKIESDIMNSPVTLNLKDQKQIGKVGEVVKNIALNNYKVVNDAVQREFPNKQFVSTTVTDEDGGQSVVYVEQKIGNFYSYFNTNNRAGGLIDEQIDDQFAAQTDILTPGTTIKNVEGVSETGAGIRTTYEKQKQSQSNLYNQKLLDLVDDSFGGNKLDVSDFKDSVITKIKPEDFDRPDDIPQAFYQIRDLGNDFLPIINKFQRQLNGAYNKYLEQPSEQSYKTYLEEIKKIENGLKSELGGMNKKLQKDFESGDKPIAPVYEMGDITFNYPKSIMFGDDGKVVSGLNQPGKFYMGRDLKAGEDVGIGVPGAKVDVSVTDPTMEIGIKSLINLKQSVQRDLNVALRNPSENSELIIRQKTILEEIDKVVQDNLGGIQAYDDWLTQKTKNYTDIYEKGQILKITTQDGTGQYVIPDEAVGKAFLTNPKSIEDFFSTLGDDPGAVMGLEAAFYDDLFKKVLNSDGLIDIAKLKNYKKNNSEIIAKLDEYMPISASLDSQIKLGIQASNRIKILNNRKKFIEFIELDNFLADGGLGTKLTFKNPDDMVKQALKDPETMTDIVKTLKAVKGENQDLLLSAFKNQLFDKFIKSNIKPEELVGASPKLPDDRAMTSFLEKNEQSIKAFYNALGDKGGYQRLLDITEAYYRLNLTGYPKKNPDQIPNTVERIFGTGIPQILSRVFAVQSGRTGFRFVTAELGMRFMQKLSTSEREKVIAAALYDRKNAEALLKMLKGEKLELKDLNKLKGAFGKALGLVGTTVDDEIGEIERQRIPYGFEGYDSPPDEGGKLIKSDAQIKRDEFNPRVPKIAQLNIPSPSNASSLAGINMAGNVTQNTIPNTAARGQAVFGQNDPIFGGIAAV